MNVLAVVTAALVLVRLSALRRFRLLPLRQGEAWFLATPVPAGFYAVGSPGSGLLGRYRRWLLAPWLADASLGLWLLAAGRLRALLLVQFVLMVLTSIFSNLLAAHFNARAAALVGPPAEPPVRTLGLSLEPRRLRDHTRPLVEIVVAAGAAWSLSVASASRSLLPGVLWLLYAQLGLLLLKVVFVRWRMPLPARRREDFVRWRSAWLGYHLHVFDALRTWFATVLLVGLAWRTRALPSAVPAVAALAGLAISASCLRGQRRLVALERELKPLELVREFPPRAVPEGRFLAGGLLFIARDHPAVLVRGPQGLALNLAHPGTYAWAGYLVGLALLSAWQVAG